MCKRAASHTWREGGAYAPSTGLRSSGSAFGLGGLRPTRLKLQPALHLGRIFLEPLPGGQRILCDIVTQDKARVPAGWPLHFHEDVPEARCMDDVLNLDIGDASSGERHSLYVPRGQEMLPGQGLVGHRANELRVNMDMWVMKRVRPCGIGVFAGHRSFLC